jgi:HEAT repeat protein
MNEPNSRSAELAPETLENRCAVQISDLLNRFLKALKAYRLYQPGHRTLTSFIGDFHQRLLSFLEQEGDLVLRVAQDQITWENLPVYENTAKEESLSFRLFIQGVRELTFHVGIPAQEVDALLEVVHQAFDSKTSVEDLLSLLWERDLRFIDFIVLDDFFEEGEQVEYDEFREQGERNDQSAATMRETMEPFLDRLLSHHQEEEAEGSALDPDIFRLKSEEVDQLRDWVAKEAERDVLLDLPMLLESALGPEAEQESQAALATLVETAFEVLAQHGKIEPTVSLLSLLARTAADQSAPTVSRAVRVALERVEPRCILQAVARRYSRLEERDRDVLSNLLAALDKKILKEVVNLLDDPDLGGVSAGVLERMAATHLDRLLSCLANCRPSVLVPMLQVVSSTANPALLPALDGFFGHADQNVRREAIRAVGRVGSPRAWSLLADLIRGEDESLRLLALRALESVPPVCYRDGLLTLVERKDFRQRSFFEKKEFLIALAKVPGEEIEAMLLGLLSKRSFFHRDAQDEVRACAATALGRRGGEAAAQALARFTSDRSPKVAMAVAQALQSSQIIN